MKRLVLSAGVLALALSAFGQGTVSFNNYNTGVPARVYLGIPMHPQLDFVSGSGYSAALLAAPGANAPEYSLIPAQPVTVFRTGTAAGLVVSLTATLVNVPVDAPVATVQMVAWENKGGLFPDWAAAKDAWYEGILRAGTSSIFSVTNIGGVLNPPARLWGLQSFSILDWSLYPPPVFLTHPQSQLAVAGQTVTFEAAATATIGAPLWYRWYRNKVQISVSYSLVLSNVQPADAGNYVVLAWSPAAGSEIYSTVSSNAVLKVIAAQPSLRTGAGYGGLDAEGFHFTLLSDPGLACDLQRSTNLLNWEGFLSVTNAAGEMSLTDPGAASQSGRFYRAVGRL